MAALLLLVIGSSLMLLRARPGEQQNVLVTERGVPESEADSVAIVPLRDRPPPTSARAAAREEPRAEPRGGEPASVASVRAEGAREVEDGEPATSADDSDRAYAEALEAYRDRKYEDAQRRFDEVNARGGHNAASAALYSAQSVRASLGCPAAAPRFEAVQQRYPDTPPGYEAAWHAAGCYRTLGDFERARHHYDLLLRVAGYADRAQAAVASLGDAEPPDVSADRERANTAPKAEASAAAPIRRKPPKPSP
jgi:TolA-binding protein